MKQVILQIVSCVALAFVRTIAFVGCSYCLLNLYYLLRLKWRAHSLNVSGINKFARVTSQGRALS